MRNAEVISYEEARGLPREKDRSWVDRTQEHRRFRILDGLHVAQLRQLDNDTLELTNLWFIASSNPDRRTVFVTFATLDIRREFEDQAIQHGMEGQAWGEKLLLDWLESVTQRKYETLVSEEMRLRKFARELRPPWAASCHRPRPSRRPA